MWTRALFMASVFFTRALAMNCFSEEGNFPPLAWQYVTTAIPFFSDFGHISTFTVATTEASLILATRHNNYTLLAVTNVFLGASIMCLLVVCSRFRSDGLGFGCQGLSRRRYRRRLTVWGVTIPISRPCSTRRPRQPCHRWRAFDRPSLVTRPEWDEFPKATNGDSKPASQPDMHRCQLSIWKIEPR